MNRIIIPLLFMLSPLRAQEYVEEDWVSPLPPDYEAVCFEPERISEPVIAYSISDACTITDIRAIGEYQFGTEQVKSEVRNMSTEEVIRRFVSGDFIYYRQISIQLHKALEAPATLACTVDMMGKNVVEAKILREQELANGRTRVIEEPLEIANNKLPDLGVFTYSSPISYTIDKCPQ